jgi:SAM-dependent methyltransferase
MFLAINMTLNRALIVFSVIASAVSAFGWSDYSTEQVFTEIYRQKKFGYNNQGEGHSGGGSTLQATAAYREFLQNFFEVFDIHSVVDLGCGDWEFSQAIDWKGINYSGFDVVGDIIKKNQKRYQSDHIHFFHADGANVELPPADLLICKDVFQHLPIADIFAIINQFPKFKYCLITNDVDAKTGTSANVEVDLSIFRTLDVSWPPFHTLDLTKPPFNLKGIKIFSYGLLGDVYKQVLFIKSQKI